jgi:hypothetical protein
MAAATSSVVLMPLPPKEAPSSMLAVRDPAIDEGRRGEKEENQRVRGEENRRKQEERERTTEKKRDGDEFSELETLGRTSRDEVTVDNGSEAVLPSRRVELVEGEATKALKFVGGGRAAGTVDDGVEGGLVGFGTGGGEESRSARLEDRTAEEGGRVEAVTEEVSADCEASRAATVEESASSSEERGTERETHLSPQIVTLSGAPPNALMFSCTQFNARRWS